MGFISYTLVDDPMEENDLEQDEEGAKNSPKKSGTSEGTLRDSTPYKLCLWKAHPNTTHSQLRSSCLHLMLVVSPIGKITSALTSNFCKGHCEISHPMSYFSVRHIQMPHIANCGPPPPLDASSFAIELWRIIKQGYNPTSTDPDNFLPWELVDKKLNASALHLIHMSLSKKDKALVWTLTSTKETYDTLT
jgi:hypothetical protein